MNWLNIFKKKPLNIPTRYKICAKYIGAMRGYVNLIEAGPYTRAQAEARIAELSKSGPYYERYFAVKIVD